MYVVLSIQFSCRKTLPEVKSTAHLASDWHLESGKFTDNRN